MRLFFVSVLSFLLLAPTFANTEKYSFEKAEALKPLIEWRDYSTSAFIEAQEQQKPIFFLLTAPSRCYRCQVYESKEYLFHPDMVKLLNEKTIPVYVDADLRQDLTRKYLEGGRPSTTVMKPNGERIYGYSGPRPVANMTTNIQNAWEQVQQESGTLPIPDPYITGTLPDVAESGVRTMITRYETQVTQSFDRMYGGFGQGQKFPQPRTLHYFLDTYSGSAVDPYIQMVTTTLANQYTSIDALQTDYNLFDPVEGGFHRYGTKRDWTPPHYEKMLYDNVGLFDLYHAYQDINPEDPYIDEVIEKTRGYIYDAYYDKEKGGFYGNTDVHGEDAYYGTNPRVGSPARVEETKYTDRNAGALLTMLHVYQRLPVGGTGILSKNTVEEILTTSLSFYADEIITKRGAYHYQQPDGTLGVRGNILDQALLTLAFVEAYETLGNKSYLKTAERLASYSLDNLYDRYSGGFFERNSPDRSLYALGDEVDLSKPVKENAIMAYALAKLYTHTEDLVYLIGSRGALSKITRANLRLDRGVYGAYAGNYILEQELLARYDEQIVPITEIVQTQQEKSWLNAYIDGTAYTADFKLSEIGLEETTNRGFLLFVLLALVAGLLSFLSPCTLPVLPAYVAHVIGTKQGSTTKHIALFMLGLIGMFTLLGLSATLLGSLVREWTTLLLPLIGVFLLVFGIFLLLGKEIGGIMPIRMKGSGKRGSILLGASMGLAWSPCVGPILLSILALASLQAHVWQGALLLVTYGIGLAVPLLLIGLFYDRRRGSSFGKRLQGRIVHIGPYTIHTTNLFGGVLFALVGLLIIFGGLEVISARGAKSFSQSWVNGLEQVLLER